jgi:hypothetical protein
MPRNAEVIGERYSEESKSRSQSDLAPIIIKAESGNDFQKQ